MDFGRFWEPSWDEKSSQEQLKIDLKTHGKNDEESRDRDFREIFSRSRGSKTRQTKVKKFLGEEGKPFQAVIKL